MKSTRIQPMMKATDIKKFEQKARKAPRQRYVVASRWPSLNTPEQLSQWALFVRYLEDLLVISDKRRISWKVMKSRSRIVQEQIKQAFTFPHMIHPFSIFRLYWEHTIVVLLLMNTIFLPLDVAFMGRETILEWSHWYGADLIIDIFCMVDVVLFFFTGIQRKEDNVILLEPAEVWTKYAKSWFLVDLVAAIPWQWIAFGLFTITSNKSLLHADEKLLQLIKSLRFVRLWRCSKVIIEEYQIRSTASQLCLFAFLWCLTAHWLACMQIITVELMYANELDADSWLAQAGGWEKGNGRLYLQSFFMAVSSMSGVNYGSSVPKTPEDICTSMISSIVGLVEYAIFITLLVEAYAVKQTPGKRYDAIKEELKIYMKTRGIQPDLQKKIMKWYWEKHKGDAVFDNEVLAYIPEHLLRLLNRARYWDVIEEVPLFRRIPEEALDRLLPLFESRLHLPGDVILQAGTSTDHVFFLHRGMATVRILERHEENTVVNGIFFGLARDMRNTYRVRVVGDDPCHTIWMNRAAFYLVVADFPEMTVEVGRAIAELKDDMEQLGRRNSPDSWCDDHETSAGQETPNYDGGSGKKDGKDRSTSHPLLSLDSTLMNLPSTGQLVSQNCGNSLVLHQPYSSICEAVVVNLLF